MAHIIYQTKKQILPLNFHQAKFLIKLMMQTNQQKHTEQNTNTSVFPQAVRSSFLHFFHFCRHSASSCLYLNIKQLNHCTGQVMCVYLTAWMCMGCECRSLSLEGEEGGRDGAWRRWAWPCPG